MRVAFVNENTLGHASYLRPLVRELERRPELEIEPRWLDATPLPPALERRAGFTIPGLRRWGLDGARARWRKVVSAHVRRQLEALDAREPLAATVVNTQSVALALTPLAARMPLFVCLDATFAQLARTPWFVPNAPSRWFAPWTLASLRRRERELVSAAARLLPWSEAVGLSLRADYAVPTAKVSVLPPSLELPVARAGVRGPRARPQLLFVGGDFTRKGGPLLCECFRREFAGRAELHLVTQTPVTAEAGIRVHRGLVAGSAPWRERWAQADLLVFPSRLETFGIVLVEALAFGVPIVSADVGAARELLLGGRAGWLLERLDAASLTTAIGEALAQPALAQAKATLGRRHAEQQFDVRANAERLAAWLAAARAGFSPP